MATSQALSERAPRRIWTSVEKRRIVELTLREGASVCVIAREHGVHHTSLYHWRALYHEGKLDARSAPSATLLPVTIMREEATAPPTAASPSSAASVQHPSIVHLTLSSGLVLRIETSTLDVALVCALLAQLQR